MEKYQPSNGSEGMWFTELYCMNCINCDPNPDGKKQCMILCRTLAYSASDPEYPKEWIYNDKGEPTCTAYVKWDWGNDGNPDDPSNPKAPPIPDPNQRDLFPLYPDARNYEKTEIKEIKSDEFEKKMEQEQPRAFRVGDILEIRGSRFRVQNLKKQTMMLKLLPDLKP